MVKTVVFAWVLEKVGQLHFDLQAVNKVQIKNPTNKKAILILLFSIFKDKLFYNKFEKNKSH